MAFVELAAFLWALGICLSPWGRPAKWSLARSLGFSFPFPHFRFSWEALSRILDCAGIFGWGPGSSGSIFLRRGLL